MIYKQIYDGIIGGLAATLVLSVLKWSSGTIPQLETITVLDNVATNLAENTGLPQIAFAGWVWHFAIGTLWWGTLFGIMAPIIPGRHFWAKGMVFGLVAAMLIMLMILPLEAAGYFGTEVEPLEPIITILYHLIYGLVLGIVYGRLIRSP